jgi:chorismate mutase
MDVDMNPQVVVTIRRELLMRLNQIAEEVREYPGPIARCDAQLGGLIEERAEIHAALAALEKT